jgi:hypothetical protein
MSTGRWCTQGNSWFKKMDNGWNCSSCCSTITVGFINRPLWKLADPPKWSCPSTKRQQRAPSITSLGNQSPLTYFTLSTSTSQPSLRTQVASAQVQVSAVDRTFQMGQMASIRSHYTTPVGKVPTSACLPNLLIYGTNGRSSWRKPLV